MKRLSTTLFLLTLLCVALNCSSVSAAEAANIVKGKKEYTYIMMERDLKALAAAYPDLVTLTSIGKSEFDRELYAISIGTGSATVFINASHHAREYFTTAIVMNQIQNLLLRESKEENVAELLQHVTIWVVPMVNPDGVSLVQKGHTIFPEAHQEKLLKMNNGSTNFKRWKANANGIDLNRQYPALWETIRNNPPAAQSENYKGSKPLTTKENQALVAFTYEIEPKLAISNHSTGRIIFWSFLTREENIQRDRKLAGELASQTGYSLVAPSSNPSGGGYTDWFISTFGLPAFTPEMAPANGGKPVSLSYFEDEWKRHRDVMLWAAQSGYQLWLDEQQPHFQETDDMIALSQPIKIYKEPNLNSYSYAKLNQAEIKVKGQWDRWFLIDTWNGERYIYLPEEQLIEEEAKVIKLERSTPLYRIPFEGAKKVGTISPQEITVVKQVKDWVKINSWLGEVWLNVNK